MDDDKLREIIKDAVLEAVAEERKAMWIDPEQHFLDHEMLRQCRERSNEWRLNHEFVSTMRAGADVARKTTWRIVTTGILTFLAASAWLFIKEVLKK